MDRPPWPLLLKVEPYVRICFCVIAFQGQEVKKEITNCRNILLDVNDVAELKTQSSQLQTLAEELT